MIQTTCRWCNRSVEVKNWEPVTNVFLEVNPLVCHPCRVEYEAGLFQMKIQEYIRKGKEDGNGQSKSNT